MYGKTLADFPDRFGEFLAEFRIESPDRLNAAFEAARGSCTEFPTPADLRRQIEKRNYEHDRFFAEKAWELVQTIMQKHWHPDIGFHSNPPQLDAATEYALRQVGGFRRMNETELKDWSFVRRDFIDAFKRHKETGGYLAPTRAEAAAVLDKLKRSELAAGDSPS